MSSNSFAWVATASGKVARVTPGGFGQEEPIGAVDISVGADSAVWVVADSAYVNETNPAQSGGQVAYRDGSGNWNHLELGGLRIDASWDSASAAVVLGDGSIVIANQDGSVAPASDADFAKDVSMGANGTLWAVGIDGTQYGNPIHFKDGDGTWNTLENVFGTCVTGKADGTALIVHDGSVMHVNQEGQILGGFPIAPGTVKEISVAPDNNAWIVTREPAPTGGNIVLFIPFDENGHMQAFQPVSEQLGATRIDAGA